jgi:Tol biopolymer transport system component
MLTHSDTDCGSIVRSSKDGSRIAFSLADDTGKKQIFLVSPLGDEDPVQATFLETPTERPWWHPSGDYIISVSAGSIYGTNVIPGDPNFGKSWMITEPTPDASPDAIVISPDGQWIAFNRNLDAGRPDGRKASQIFVTAFVVPEPSAFVLAALGLFSSLAFFRRRR